MKVLNYKKDPVAAVDQAVRALSGDAVAVYPTDSCYGMGGRLDSRPALEKVYALKGRGKDKAVPVLVHALSALEGYAVVDAQARALVRAFMPGLLTLVVPRGPRCPAFLPGRGIGFRIPAHAVARALCQGLQAPLVGTSANPAGAPEPYTVSEALAPFGEGVDLALDAGRLPRRPPSTVLDVARGRVLREGPVPADKVLEALERARARD